MKIVHFDSIESYTGKISVIVLGAFDALHRGHDRLFRRALSLDSENSAVVTFAQNPATLLMGDSYHGDVLTFSQKIEQFSKMGFKKLILIDFSLEFSKMTGETFINSLIKINGLRHILAGSDFRCGNKGEMRVQEIKKIVSHYGIKTHITPLKRYKRRKISSSDIRMLIKKGDIKRVEEMLGRSYEIDLPEAHQAGVFTRDSFHQLIPDEGQFYGYLSSSDEVVDNEGTVLVKGTATRKKGKRTWFEVQAANCFVEFTNEKIRLSGDLRPGKNRLILLPI